MQILYVGIGGFIGASLRYITTINLHSNCSFPLITIFINFLGAFFISLMATLSLNYPFISKEFQTFFQAGVCGGFSTFAAFSLEVVAMIDNGQYILALAYASISVFACLVGVILARAIANLVS